MRKKNRPRHRDRYKDRECDGDGRRQNQRQRKRETDTDRQKEFISNVIKFSIASTNDLLHIKISFKITVLKHISAASISVQQKLHDSCKG